MGSAFVKGAAISCHGKLADTTRDGGSSVGPAVTAKWQWSALVYQYEDTRNPVW